MSRLRSLDVEDIGLSSVVLGELLVGVKKRGSVGQERELLRFAGQYPPVGVGPQESVEYAAIRAELEMLGTSIGANDLWIAAQARANDLTVVTANVREFSRVRALRIENWEKPAE